MSQTDEKNVKDNAQEEDTQQTSAEETAAAEEKADSEDQAQEIPEDKETEETRETEKSEEESLRGQLADANDKYLRLMAEYDNFRKRSAKERLELSASITGDTISGLLPVLDNFERALQTETADKKYKEGVEMIFRQLSDAIAKLGVEVIDPTGETFDPNTSNAVSQTQDPELGENVVAQTFQKGYRLGGRVLRYAMVAVANP